MHEEQLLIVKWVNDLLGPVVASLRGIPYAPGAEIIPMQIVMATIVLLVLMAFFTFHKSRTSVLQTWQMC